MKQKFVVGKFYKQIGTGNLYIACSLGEIVKGIFLVDLKTGMSITNIYSNSNELEKQTNSMGLDLTEVEF